MYICTFKDQLSSKWFFSFYLVFHSYLVQGLARNGAEVRTATGTKVVNPSRLTNRKFTSHLYWYVVGS